jgi:hypothetical protein
MVQDDRQEVMEMVRATIKRAKEEGRVYPKVRVRSRDKSSLEHFIKTKEQGDSLMAELLAMSRR